jgi:hypothetical protein
VDSRQQPTYPGFVAQFIEAEPTSGVSNVGLVMVYENWHVPHNTPKEIRSFDICE